MKSDFEELGDRHWNAFRYVAQEMTREEEIEFEHQLMHDQLLREQIGKMTQTLSFIEEAYDAPKVELTAPSAELRLVETENRVRTRRWLVVTVALTMIGALAVSFAWKPAKPEISTETIAIAWAEASATDEFELLSESGELEFASPETSDDSGDDSAEDEFRWIEEAVFAIENDF